MELKFRPLRADEVDVRVAMVKDTPSSKGVQLLLYKDARCDMNILDETVGQLNWQRRHSRENANCIVEIWDEEKNQWVAKEDTGTESNTEKEKGLASDSFKRACFNWGIGRELYTAPFIWVKAPAVEIKDRKTYDRFSVRELVVENGKITRLVVWNDTQKCQVYPQKDAKPAAPVTTPVAESGMNPPVCCDCLCLIESYGKKTPQEMARYTKAKYGRALCAGCATEAAKAGEGAAS